MMATINYRLKKLSGEFYIGKSGTERKYIDDRINIFSKGLKSFFGKQIKRVELFGSYKRSTILPRYFDDESDIDILIIFNNDDQEFRTETYRNRLRRFAVKKYPRSIAKKDFPSIVLMLRDIKFDLVPCLQSVSFWGNNKYHIPDSDGNWIETDPHGFNKNLTTANQSYGNIVKPLIRLMKRWNAFNGYVYDSYGFEQEIAKMNFQGDDLQSGFFYIIENLPTYYLPAYKQKKVKTLQGRKEWIIEYLDRGDQNKAFATLYKILGLKY